MKRPLFRKASNERGAAFSHRQQRSSRADAGVLSLAPLLPWQYALLAYALGLASWQNLPAALLGLLLMLLVARSLTGARLAAVLAALVLGAAVAVLLAPKPGVRLPAWVPEDASVLVQGRVATVEPRRRDALRLVLEDLRSLPPKGADAPQAWQDLQGKLLWTWYQPLQTPAPGSLLQVRLNLRPLRGMANHALWDYEAWWRRKGVRYKSWSRGGQGEVTILEAGDAPLWRWRQALRARVLERLRPAEGQGRAMLFALLLGERQFLEQESVALFRDAGVAHSLALSGLHVGMVVLLGFLLARAVGHVAPGLFNHLPRQKLGALLGGLLALGYLWLGGLSPSLLRAGLMFFFWGFLYLRGRENCLLDGLLLALAVILVAAPQWAYDMRLQLSVTAVAGIACLLELVRLWRRRRQAARKAQGAWEHEGEGLAARLGRWLLLLLLVGLASQLAVLPILVWDFGRVAFSLWLNMLWLPALGFVVMPLGLLGLLSSVLPWEGAAVACFDMAVLPAQGFLTLLARLQQEDLLPVLRAMRAGWPAWVGYWSALLLLVLALRQWLREGCAQLTQAMRAALMVALLLLPLPALRAGMQALDGGVSLRLFDVGQGQSLLLDLPAGRRLLLDGGGFAFSSFDIGDAIIAPAVTANRPPWLTWMVLSHADSDHSLGLVTPLQELGVRQFASNGRLPSKGRAEALRRVLEAKGLGGGQHWQAGDRVALGQGVALEVLHPDAGFTESSDNESSLALRLTWHGRGLALLPGDLQEQGLAALLQQGADLRAEVLLLPHHGGWSGLEPRLLQESAPCLALASVGFRNRYDLPREETLQAARALGVPVVTTAQLGAITLRWPGPGEPPELESVRAGRLELPARRLQARR